MWQDGSTLLHAAARAGTLEAVDSLVTAKADVRTQSEVGEAHAPHSESRVVAALANAWGGGCCCCGDGEREEGTRGTAFGQEEKGERDGKKSAGDGKERISEESMERDERWELYHGRVARFPFLH